MFVAGLRSPATGDVVRDLQMVDVRQSMIQSQFQAGYSAALVGLSLGSSARHRPPWMNKGPRHDVVERGEMVRPTGNY